MPAQSNISREARLMERDIRALGDVDADDLEGALHEAAEFVTAEMEARVPVDTGELRDSITFETVRKEHDAVEVVVGFERDGWYAHFPEFGTVHMPPTPFMRPAFDENEVAIFSIINLSLRAGIIG